MHKAIAMLLLSVPATMLAQTPKLTIDDLLNPRYAVGAERGRGDGETSDGKYIVTVEKGQIALRPKDGGESKILTSTPEPKSELELSPDGQRVAYISGGQVWVVALDGASPLQLTHDPAGPGDPRGATDHHPQWNPNGKWILYESGQKGFNELYVVSQDGKTLNLLAATEIYHGADAIKSSAPDHGDAVSSDRFDPHPLWSPDGTRVSFTERSREFFSGKLEVLSFDQGAGTAVGHAKEIYVAKNDPGGAWAVNTVSWSPDNRTLAVVLQETHWDKIWTIPSSGGRPKELTFGGGEDEAPVYSPDGKWIAFESNRDLPEERHIWVVSAGGGEPHRITRLQGIESGPRWNADSNSIRFTWRSTLGASANYVADISGKDDPKLQGAVRPSPYEGLGITPEIVHYKSKDGLALAGILYKPAGYEAGKRYPAVILPHGGPEGQVILSATPWSVFLADHGYVVLEPNFRGSTGYGERFRNANVEDSGGGEIDDIAASAKYLVDVGLVDPKRVGISGGSHGGTVVANAVAKLPDTFAVGIEKFGVVDRALFLRYTNRNSAIRWETKMGGPPELKPAVYRKANILPDVDRIKTPLLILHGEEDPQVPPQESQELAAALKKDGKTFTYITYPGEGHGFQQLEHRRDAYEKEFAFLNKYLQPDLGQ
ncbi:prolyl oligopeptidase family serine peptidase [Silvibacterium sp.]|uniref:S9 family peptidase n=1 Tax=Silvibacterium sp. TaxID=1964179 RepID=UPI0039E5BCBA